jgi:hypothetical protein
MEKPSDIEISVSVNVLCKTQEEVVKAAEVLTRAATALSLEKTTVSVNFTPYGEDV